MFPSELHRVGAEASPNLAGKMAEKAVFTNWTHISQYLFILTFIYTGFFLIEIISLFQERPGIFYSHLNALLFMLIVEIPVQVDLGLFQC